MAVCGACGEQTSRLKTKFKGESSVDCCPQCAPEEFTEKFTVPSDKRIWVGHEYMPNMYKKLDDGTYEAKDELRADTEAQVTKESEDDKLAYETAVEKKRSERRTRPMSEEEIRAAKHKVERLFNSSEVHVQ